MTFSEIERDSIPNELRFSASRLASYDSCSRKHHYIYRQGYRVPYTNKHLTLGSILHRLLHLHYEQNVSPAEAYPQLKIEFPTYQEQLLLFPAIALIDRYIKYFQDKDTFKVIGVEKELIVPYVTPNGVTVYLHGILDLVGITDKDKLFVMDHKSSARKVWNADMVWFDHQIAFYLCILMQCDFMPQIGVVNQLSTATTDTKKMAMTPGGDLFSRFPVEPTPTLMENWLKEFGNKIDKILEETSYPKALSNRCSGCQFKDACLTDLRGGDPTPYLETTFKDPEKYNIEIEIEGLDD